MNILTNVYLCGGMLTLVGTCVHVCRGLCWLMLGIFQDGTPSYILKPCLLRAGHLDGELVGLLWGSWLHLCGLWTVDWDYKWATMPTDLNIVFGSQIQQQTHQLQRHAPKFSYGLWNLTRTLRNPIISGTFHIYMANTFTIILSIWHS